MQVSQARLEANRRNAAKSTGPRTVEGKLASRGNALKHGMTGSGTVMVGGDAAEVARRSEAIEAELQPSGELGRALVRRLALHSVRMERGAIQEAAALSERVGRAGDDFDDARLVEVESAFAGLGADPAGSVRRLRRMPEGVDRLIAAWLGLAADLGRPEAAAWDDARGRLVDHLMGRSPAEVSESVASGLSRAILGSDADAGGPGDPQARGRLLDLIDREVAQLRDHRATLDLGAIAADRLGAPERALFDPSREATLARKYEAAAERGFFRALREFRHVEAEALDRPSAPPPVEAAPRPPLASFAPAPAPAVAVAGPKPAAPAPRPAPVESRPGAVSTLDFTIGRPAPGPASPPSPGPGLQS